MSKYSDLQKEAASLGLKAVGVSKEELEKAIATAKDMPSTNPEVETPAEVDNANTAIVFDKVNHEVRRYSIDLHGKSFAELAYQFATDRGFKVVLENTRDGIQCPKCGHIFNVK